MEPSALTKAGSKQEEGFGVQSRRVADLGLGPNLRRSNSSLCRSRRSQYLFNSCEKVGFPWPSDRRRGDVPWGRNSRSGRCSLEGPEGTRTGENGPGGRGGTVSVPLILLPRWVRWVNTVSWVRLTESCHP